MFSTLTTVSNFFSGDHTEAVELDYDPKIVNYMELLDIFWNNHEYGLTTVVKKQVLTFVLFNIKLNQVLFLIF